MDFSSKQFAFWPDSGNFPIDCNLRPRKDRNWNSPGPVWDGSQLAGGSRRPQGIKMSILLLGFSAGDSYLIPIGFHLDN